MGHNSHCIVGLHQWRTHCRGVAAGWERIACWTGTGLKGGIFSSIHLRFTPHHFCIKLVLHLKGAKGQELQAKHPWSTIWTYYAYIHVYICTPIVGDSWSTVGSWSFMCNSSDRLRNLELNHIPQTTGTKREAFRNVYRIVGNTGRVFKLSGLAVFGKSARFNSLPIFPAEEAN